MRKYKLLLLAALLINILVLTSCSEGGSGSSYSGEDTATDGTSYTGDSSTEDLVYTSDDSNTSGVTSSSDITVENGNIVVNTEDGESITINGSNLDLVEQGDDGNWVLIDGVTITLTDNDGSTVEGTVSVDASTGVITFTPSTDLDSDETYTVSVTVDGTQYDATVIIAVDDTESEESQFAGATYITAEDISSGTFTSETYSISDIMVKGRALWGWEFGDDPTAFQIKLSGISEGETVYLTAYGTYNIEGHENEIYYQMWASGSNEGEPVKDYVWGGSAITVNEEDSSLDGETDYSFWATYIELKVMKDGEDVTTESDIKLIVNTVE